MRDAFDALGQAVSEHVRAAVAAERERWRLAVEPVLTASEGELPNEIYVLAGFARALREVPAEDDRPLVARILEALPEQPPTPFAGWARYRNECADFVDRLRAALKD